MLGSTETSNDLAPVVGSRQRSYVSVLSPHLDVSHANLFDKWFRQMIPMSIRHTILTGTNYIPTLKNPRLPHTLGAPDPKTQTIPQLFARAEEEALGVSFKDQSQEPDIPLISTRKSLSIYTGSFDSQSNFDTKIIVDIHWIFRFPIQGPRYLLTRYQRRTLGFL